MADFSADRWLAQMGRYLESLRAEESWSQIEQTLEAMRRQAEAWQILYVPQPPTPMVTPLDSPRRGWSVRTLGGS